MNDITCDECGSVYQIHLKKRTPAQWNTNIRYIHCPICGKITSPFIFDLNRDDTEVKTRHEIYLEELEKRDEKDNAMRFLAYLLQKNKIKFALWKDKLIQDRILPIGFKIGNYLNREGRVVTLGDNKDDFFQLRAKGD